MCCLVVLEPPLPVRKMQLRPERLTADFQQVNGTLITTIHWRMSHHALGSIAVEGFQFTWTLQSELSAATEQLEDARVSQTQTIASVRKNFHRDSSEGNPI